MRTIESTAFKEQRRESSFPAAFDSVGSILGHLTAQLKTHARHSGISNSFLCWAHTMNDVIKPRYDASER